MAAIIQQIRNYLDVIRIAQGFVLSVNNRWLTLVYSQVTKAKSNLYVDAAIQVFQLHILQSARFE